MTQDAAEIDDGKNGVILPSLTPAKDIDPALQSSDPSPEPGDTQEKKQVDPVQQLQEAIAERPYGELVTDEKGNDSLAISDDDFARDFASVMKARTDI